MRIALALVKAAAFDAAEEAVERIEPRPDRSRALIWMALLCSDSARAQVWTKRAQETWDSADASVREASFEARCAFALLKAHQTQEAPAALPRPENAENSDQARALIELHLALGRSEPTLPLIEELGLWNEGVGWSIPFLELREDAFLLRYLERLLDSEGTLLSRFTAALEANDEVFLAMMCLGILLTDRKDAAQQLRRVSSQFQSGLFLRVLASMDAPKEPVMVAQTPALTPPVQAIANALIGDRAAAKAHLERSMGAQPSRCGRKVAILAAALNEPAAFEQICAEKKDGYELKRIAVGALRAWVVRSRLGETSGDTVSWPDLIEALVRGQSRPADRWSSLAELGMLWCQHGFREQGTPMLEEAFGEAEQFPKDQDRGYGRQTLLEEVGCLAIRAGECKVAMQALRKCTPKHRRIRLARRLAIRFAEQGDFVGAARILEYIPPGEPQDYLWAAVQTVRASVPGWKVRWSAAGLRC